MKIKKITGERAGKSQLGRMQVLCNDLHGKKKYSCLFFFFFNPLSFSVLMFLYSIHPHITGISRLMLVSSRCRMSSLSFPFVPSSL